MTTTETPEMIEAQELIDRALKLPTPLREKIGLEVLHSVDYPPIDPEEEKAAFRAELQRRLDDIKSGKTKTYSVAEAMAYLRQEFAERNNS